jgi:hypothetical protein
VLWCSPIVDQYSCGPQSQICLYLVVSLALFHSCIDMYICQLCHFLPQLGNKDQTRNMSVYSLSEHTMLWPLCIFCGRLVNFCPFWYIVLRKIWQTWPPLSILKFVHNFSYFYIYSRSMPILQLPILQLQCLPSCIRLCKALFQ